MADDLAAWLTQIWDEDEAGTREATAEADERWEEIASGVLSIGGPDGDVIVTGDSRVSRFMERNDPAAVLARIAADRQILELHRPNGRNILGYPVCDACTPLKPTPCKTVRLLALPHADRPGYREEWRP